MKTKSFVLIVSLILSISNQLYCQIPDNVPTSGLVAFWPFNGNANDYFNNYNGIANNPNMSNDRFNIENASYLFDGINDTINIFHNGDLSFDVNENFTISLWFNCYNLSLHSPDLLYHKNSSYNGYGITVLREGHVERKKIYINLEADVDGSNYSMYSVDTVQLNRWYNVTLVYNGVEGYAEMYLDATFQIRVLAPENFSGLIGNPLTPLSIGKRVGESTPTHFDGKIDDIGIWNRVLTYDEIFQLYYNASVDECEGITKNGDSRTLLGNFIDESGIIKTNAELNKNGKKLYLPTVETSLVTGITESSAVSGGNIAYLGNSDIVNRGIVWSTNPNPTMEMNVGIYYNDCGTGSFISYLTGLSSNTTYYVRAFAECCSGITYGQEQSFNCQTPDIPLQGINVPTDSQIQWNWNTVAGATGYKYNTVNNYTTASDNGTNTAFTQTGLNVCTSYNIYVWAYNSCGVSTGQTLYATTTGSAPASPTVGTHVASQTQIVWNWSAVAGVTGYKYNTVNNYATATDNGTNTTFTQTGLTCGNSYSLYIWAYNSCGNSAVRTLTQSTNACPFICGTSTVTFDYKGSQVTYGTVVGDGGRCWLDRNLGATSVGGNGDLFQWGRDDDGHQTRTSPTTTLLSSTDSPGTNEFILNGSIPGDWRSPQNGNLWQGVSGINNPCPTGWRIPTENEWLSETSDWYFLTARADALKSPLKVPSAGARGFGSGVVSGVGTYGFYWTTTKYLGYAGFSKFLKISLDNLEILYCERAYGFSVRCIKN